MLTKFIKIAKEFFYILNAIIPYKTDSSQYVRGKYQIWYSRYSISDMVYISIAEISLNITRYKLLIFISILYDTLFSFMNVY